MIATTLLLTSASIVPSNAYEQISATELDRRLTPQLEQAVAVHELPGLAVAIVGGGETIYMRGFGTAERGTERAVTAKSIFHMASVSKPFVATAIMTLVEAGKLELDDTVVKHLPYFRLADERAREITIRQVLQHRSGMPDVSDYEWDKPQHDEGAAERFVRSLTDEQLLYAPGTSGRYSNMAFDVMGDLIAKVSGESFEDYVEQTILKPLGMTTTSFIHSRTPEEHRTRGHSNYYSSRIDNYPSPHYPYNRRHAPSSTLNSNLEDMCRWLQFNLYRGSDQAKRPLSQTSFDQLFGVSSADGAGLSWMVDSSGGPTTIQHSGGDVGFSANVYMVPELKLGIVLMGNCDATPIGALTALCLGAVEGRSVNMPPPGIGLPFARILEADGVDAAIDSYGQLREHPTIRYRYGFDELDRVGHTLLRQERFEDAVAVMGFNMMEYMDSVDGLVSLAQALQGMGETGEARALLEQALEMNPKHGDARDLLQGL